MKKVDRTLITDILSALFILLFVYTAITKLVERESFNTILRQSPLIGTASNTLSFLLPTIELITALLLFIPSVRMWGFASSFFLMVIFTFYITYMILFTPNLPCSCGGVLAYMTWKEHLVFNIFFTALAAIGLRFSLRNKLFIAINRQS
jgi:putative oxidoreductase